MELLFINSNVDDIDTILGNLRTGVEAMLLDPAHPAAQQIAAVLEGRRGLDAVHVIAHGAPGRINFAAGTWSAETLAEDAKDLAAIGRALTADGGLRLWSCHTASGLAGADFVKHLAQARGADVAAATARVGDATVGGRWELEARSTLAATEPPLTAIGIDGYAGC